MRGQAAVVLAAGLLAACGTGAGDRQGAPATPADTEAGTPSPVSDGVPVASLAGEWRVAGVDGREIAGNVGIALSGDAEAIWWEPRCAGVVVRYRIEGLRFAVLRAPSPETVPTAGTVPPARPVCTIMPPPDVPAIATALRAATRIERLASNGILLSGGGHSVLLFSQ